jgi:hypothetical protein
VAEIGAAALSFQPYAKAAVFGRYECDALRLEGVAQGCDRIRGHATTGPFEIHDGRQTASGGSGKFGLCYIEKSACGAALRWSHFKNMSVMVL